MKFHFFLILIFLTAASSLTAQQISKEDTVRLLNEVVVKAYASDRPLLEVPAAIGVVRDFELNRFNNTSILPAVNMVAGVRMEERSPGSYRFSIRGSSLRSPFGVRNVKFYWNGLPLTDGGGNTYLNLIDFNSVGSVEIIKGPGASLYGAGTGGVVLLQSPKSARDLNYSALAGSYGLFRIQGGGSVLSTKKFQMDTRLGFQQSDGYRQQTKMNRLIAQIDLRGSISTRSFLSATVFSTQLYYETPGGLTQAQYDNDPRQARPSTTTSPGAVDQKAAVNNKTTYAGVSFEHEWNEKWSTRVGLFGSVTGFKNPTIRNFEKRDEQNWGGRTDTYYRFDKQSWKGKITFGAEYQHFYSPVTVYDNILGTPGNVQTDDKLRSTLFLSFAQIELDLPKNFYLTLGGSGNFINYKFLRTSLSPEVRQERNFDPVVSPRIALLKKISSAISVYGNVSSGFSPPSLAEVRPSTGAFNNSLNAERGVSYEMGVKGKIFNQVEANLALYDFRLKQTIVIQRDASGADYFINAGATSQRGVELMLAWSPQLSTGKISALRVWSSYTYNYYRFKDYVNDGKDYSGNAVTGVAPNILVGGADVRFLKSFYFNLTGNYTNRLPLNDANTDYASDFFLIGARAGYKLDKKIPLEFFLGVDNALDQRYSLGNDLNAVGGRYYNAAAGRNLYVGIVARLITRPDY